MSLWITSFAIVAIIFTFLQSARGDRHVGTAGSASEYTTGDSVKLECKDWFTGNWSHGPICKESGEELSITFGYDSFLYCGLEITDEKVYQAIVALAKLEKTWQCRVPMSKARDFFVPFTIPIWGVVEDDHLHIDNHLNFVFHVDEGKIIATAAYPVRDRFQFGKPGSLISMHGPVRWFHRHAFQSLLGSNPIAQAHLKLSAEEDSSILLVLSCSVLSSLVTMLAAVVLYQRKLKPRLMKRYNKDR